MSTDIIDGTSWDGAAASAVGDSEEASRLSCHDFVEK